MGTLTDVQILKKDGEPAFAVIPYKEYLMLVPKAKDDSVPHEVVGLVIKKEMNLVKAWRIHLGLTQREVARRAGISQAALSQMERRTNALRTTTLEKLARAMDLSVAQLQD